MASLLGISQNLSRNCVFSSGLNSPTSHLLGYISKQNKPADSLCCTAQQNNTTPNGFSNSRHGAGDLTTYWLGSAHPERTQPDGWPLTSPLCMATSQTATWVSSARGDTNLPPGKSPALFLFYTMVKNTTLPWMDDLEVTRGLNRSISYLDLQPWSHSLGGKGK